MRMCTQPDISNQRGVANIERMLWNTFLAFLSCFFV